jgi:hypothetical protein
MEWSDSGVMKTNKLLTLSIVASCALGASALAEQTNKHPARNAENKSREAEKARPTWDDQPMPLRAIGYPVVFLGRAGHSIMRSPQIVSETSRGDRTFISKHGVFVPREADRAD